MLTNLLEFETVFEGAGEEAQSKCLSNDETPQHRILSIAKKIKEKKEGGKKILKGGYLSYKREVKNTIFLFFETCLQYIADNDLEVLILLPLFSKQWNYKHVPLRPVFFLPKT